MAASRRVSYEQLEVLWEFLNIHKDLAMGHNKCVQAREMSRRLWMEAAQNLNCLVGGAVKEPKGWAAYWVDYKGKIKRKCTAIRVSQSRTGGGPRENITLTEIEKKYLSILGEDYGMGLPGIQVNPLDTDSTNAPSTSSQSILENIHISHIEVGEEIVDNRLSPRDMPQGTAIIVEQPVAVAIPSTSQPAAEGNSVRRPRRQRRRATPMSQDDVRRSLIESSRLRAQATQNINETLISILNILTQMVAIFERQENR